VKRLFLLVVFTLFMSCSRQIQHKFYPSNSGPLKQTKFVTLPLGSVKPAGWLQDQLAAQANGLTGHLDEFWPDIQQSAWQGKNGEAWERGPHYLEVWTID
jgi:uncharacterized protein